jgi:hypothetical protein
MEAWPGLQGMCGVGCLREADGEPDTGGALVQQKLVFHEAVITCLQHFLRNYQSLPFFICHRVEALDRLVTAGTVHRAIAGRVASMLVRAPGCDIAFGMLHVALHGLSHGSRTHCTCVYRVLSWGTCPHVAHVLNTRLPWCDVWTPLAMCSTAHVDALLSFGSYPWLRLKRPCGSGARTMEVVRVTPREEQGYVHLHFPSALHRWRRWHARLHKRQWLHMSVWLSSWP